MLLKTIIVILFIAIVASLFGGLNFLVKDMGNSKTIALCVGYTYWLAVILWQPLFMVYLQTSWPVQLGIKNCIRNCRTNGTEA